MLRSLLIGLDGTPASEPVLELGLRWARRFDALLVGLGVVDEPGIHGPEEALVGETYFERINESLLKDTRHRVDQILQRCAVRCAEAAVAFKPLEDVGTPYVQILKEAQRYDLVLLGRTTHFRFGWDSVGDDTLSRVLAASPRPVVAVPDKIGESESVLVAYDGSLQAARALAIFEASGLGEGKDVSVLCASADAREAAKQVDRAVDFLQLHAIKATPHTLSNYNTTAEAILDFARQIDAGLIVMGAYGQPTLREFFLGSVTRSVMRGSPVPLFLFH